MRVALGPDDPAAEYVFHDREEVKSRFYCAGTDPEPVGAVSYAAGSISGYKFGVGVLKLALQKGLNLQTNTPAVNDSVPPAATEDDGGDRTRCVAGPAPTRSDESPEADPSVAVTT